uniref:Conotoxin n=1 Tax=Conus betulinus TaxID=89764 RepID=A0A1P7ZCS5_CONBE|nr:Conotoxin [Conus betulinus]
MTMDMKMMFSGFVLIVCVTTVVGWPVLSTEVHDNLIHCRLPEFRVCLRVCWETGIEVDCYASCTYDVATEHGPKTEEFDCTVFKTCYGRCIELGKSEHHCWEGTARTVTGKVTDLDTC